MKDFTVWINKSGVTFFIGGDPKDGKPPIITGHLEKPQIKIDPDKGEITITEHR